MPDRDARARLRGGAPHAGRSPLARDVAPVLALAVVAVLARASAARDLLPRAQLPMFGAARRIRSRSRQLAFARRAGLASRRSAGAGPVARAALLACSGPRPRTSTRPRRRRGTALVSATTRCLRRPDRAAVAADPRRACSSPMRSLAPTRLGAAGARRGPSPAASPLPPTRALQRDGCAVRGRWYVLGMADPACSRAARAALAALG
jgi:hypothetical protein